MQVDLITQHHLVAGVRGWRKLIHCLMDVNCLYGPFGEELSNVKQVCAGKCENHKMTFYHSRQILCLPYEKELVSRFLCQIV